MPGYPLLLKDTVTGGAGLVPSSSPSLPCADAAKLVHPPCYLKIPSLITRRHRAPAGQAQGDIGHHGHKRKGMPESRGGCRRPQPRAPKRAAPGLGAPPGSVPPAAPWGPPGPVRGRCGAAPAAPGPGGGGCSRRCGAAGCAISTNQVAR